MRWLIPLLMFSASVMAHPIEQLYPVAQDLSENYEQVEQCTRAVDSSSGIDSSCDYLASRGARVLEILVRSLEHENIPVLRENRKELKQIALENLGVWELLYGAWVLTDDDLERTSKYLGRERPDMIKPYLSDDVYNKLEKGGFLD